MLFLVGFSLLNGARRFRGMAIAKVGLAVSYAVVYKTGVTAPYILV